MNKFIETDRLFIRPLGVKDVEFILELLNTKGWLQFIGDRNVKDNKSANDYINKILSNNKFYYNVFEIKETQLPIGIVTFLYRENQQFPDIGFAMLPKYEKNGFAFEAAKSYLDEIKQSNSVEKIIAITKSDNNNSIGLLKKLGLIFEKTYDDNGEQLNMYSTNFIK
jgi:RimJ/RimL family protein N-acetyltransferase